MDTNSQNLNIETQENKEIEINSQVEYSDKIETKGLKLKKCTKDKLNALQGQFEDAETMIVSLLQMYNTNQIESSDKFIDRKAEIQRFNFLLDSLKGSFVNSLEMATYAEEKSSEKFKKEIQRRNLTIENLQNDNNEYKERIKSYSESNKELVEELNSVKDSFSRVNLALTTVERELKEKSDIIQNTQRHIESLNLMIGKEEESKRSISELTNKIIELEDIQKKYDILNQAYINSKEESSKLYIEIDNLKTSNEKQREYSDALNEKIQTLLSTHASDISKLNDTNRNLALDIQLENNTKLNSANKEILDLKEMIYSLKLENERMKFIIENSK